MTNLNQSDHVGQEDTVKTNIDRLVRRPVNKRYRHAAGTLDLTASTITSVERCDDNTGNVWSASGSGSVAVAEPDTTDFPLGREIQNICPRGFGDMIKLQYVATADYAQLALSAKQDWSTGGTYYLAFWIIADRAIANTEFDLEIRNSGGSVVTGGDLTFSAYNTAWKPQLYVIAINGATTTDVQYLRLVMDGSTATNIWICDIVRTEQNVFATNAYLDCHLAAALDGAGRYMVLRTSNWTTGETADLYLNSLANSPITIYEGQTLKVLDEPVHAFFINNVTADTSISIDVDVSGRFD